MISARRQWQEKKSLLDEARAARAHGEYQAYLNGGGVDPALITRQQQAQEELDAVRAEISPLVHEARDSGMASEVVDLYERSLVTN
ncbi:MAG: hypothetical protein JRG96_13910 [Deltaproteobacteria bacterium]|nr:hypothetical protein [Deltaproteobacteria bacterium]